MVPIVGSVMANTEHSGCDVVNVCAWCGEECASTHDFEGDEVCVPCLERESVARDDAHDDLAGDRCPCGFAGLCAECTGACHV